MKFLPRLLLISAALAGSALLAQSDSGPAEGAAATADAPKGPKKIGFAIMPTAKLSPDTFKKTKEGPFKLPFVREPKPLPNPELRAEIPPELVALQQEGYVRAALKIGVDGKVTAIGIIDSGPKGVVEQSAITFFQQLAYEPELRKRQPIEFETDVFLGYKFIVDVPPQKGPPGKKR